MSRGAAVGVLALLLAGVLPVQGQQWKGERLCAPPQLPSGAEFGSAVAVSDQGTIAVGAYRHDRVYLFRRDAAGGCEQFAEIQSPSPNAWFGFALAIHGNQLLVGAPKSDGIGAAYLYELPTAKLLQTVTVPQAQRGDEVGSSVAIYVGTLALGARGTDGRRGRVYLGSATHLEVVPPPERESLAPNAELGQSVALSGTTLVMGAPSPFRGSDSPGAAWVFEIGSPAPRQLTPPGGLEPEAAFGYAVAVAGTRILVGAPLANRNGEEDAGVVFSFSRREDGSWGEAQEPLLTGGRGDQLGVAIALDGETAVVGARYARGTRGTAYLKKGNGPSQALEQAVPTGAQLGVAVAIRGDHVVVGAFREGGKGAAYLFQPVRAVEIVVATEVQEIEKRLSVRLRSGDGNSVPPEVRFRLQTLAGTAEERPTEGAAGDHDYLRLDSEVNVPAQMEIQLFPDDVCEQPETFQVVLSDLKGTRIQAVQVTIVDDDPAGGGGFEISPAQLNTSEDGTSVPLSVGLTCPPSGEVTVSFKAIPPLASFSSPTLTFMSQESLEVEVSGIDNAVCGPAVVPYEIQATITSTEDPRFVGLSHSIPAENADDELACLSPVETVCIDGGGTVVYTISLVNSVSGVPDTPALLLDDLPAGVSVVTASADRGTATADPIANSVRWTVPVPAGGEAATITIVAALDGPPGPALGNQAEATYDRDSRDHRETVQIVFSAEDVVPCPP